MKTKAPKTQKVGGTTAGKMKKTPPRYKEPVHPAKPNTTSSKKSR